MDIHRYNDIYSKANVATILTKVQPCSKVQVLQDLKDLEMSQPSTWICSEDVDGKKNIHILPKGGLMVIFHGTKF